MADLRISLVLFFLSRITSGWSFCYFPTEFQGEFSTQSSSRGGANIQYAPVTVLPESIPVWGICHRRVGNRVILMDKTGGTNCVRCFQLTLRSINIVQIHTEGLDKCYTTEEAAMATCPTDESIANGQSREIMLYKTKDLSGEPVVAEEYCPISGRYMFTYSLNDGIENVSECQEPVSELSNCPYGFGLNLRFRRCSFGELEMNFQCLGDWVGHNGERYMALSDVQDTAVSGAEKRPRYRCALYKEDLETGKIYVALSSDSTCQNDLKSSRNGYETLVLTVKKQPPPPFEVSTGSCRFPTWSHGQWQDAYIEPDTLVYKDLRNFRTYTVKCMVDDKSHAHPESRFVVYARTQCGDEFYTCLAVEKRGVNVMEFQLGVRTSTTFNQSLCHEEKFPDQTWVTQGRINVFSEEACPISGEYTGFIPDATGFCAKLYSDCHSPQKMYYTVSNCNNQSDIYEEREYRCLGQWTDKGLTYTYTQRRDVLGYECFVGVIITENELFIKEAGEHCQRDVQPLKLGMKLTRQATCFAPRPSSKPSFIGASTPNLGTFNDDSNAISRADTPHRSNEITTKIWKENPGILKESSGSTINKPWLLSLLCIVYYSLKLL